MNAVRDNVKCGLEFQGGYELIYQLEPKPGQGPVTQDQLVSVGETLQSRASGQGISELQVQPLSGNKIDLKLPGASVGGDVRTALGQGGDLPVQLQETYSQTVGGVLGQEDLSNTREAGVVVLLLILRYGVSALVAIFSSIVYLWLLLAVFNWVGGIMSEAAIVAFVLGIAIAADANIISFERVREKLREGRPMHEALPTGERSALRTILDANASAVIVGAVRA